MLVPIIAAYTLLMLAIHVSTGKILEGWSGPASSWMNRWFPQRRALRIEAAYWVLVIAAWPLWPSHGWKIVVAIFAAIHVAIWLAGEFRLLHYGPSGGSVSGHSRWKNRAIIIFDLIEAIALVGVGWLTTVYLLHPNTRFV